MTDVVDVRVDGDRTLRAYDSGGSGPVLVWHPGSPHTGAPLAPLMAAAADRGLRLVTYARPSYGTSTPQVGRDAADGANDTVRIVDAFGVDRFALIAYSGGGPSALAGAALFPDRATAVITFASMAPYTDAFDWFAGMRSDGALRAAVAGRDARRRYADTHGFDPETFTQADWAALSDRWGALGQDAQAAEGAGPDGLVDDDVASTSPWRADLAAITAPVLLVHGTDDRIIPYAHAEWLHRAIAGSEFWSRPGDGHVSVLNAVPAALDWLLDRTR